MSSIAHRLILAADVTRKGVEEGATCQWSLNRKKAKDILSVEFLSV